MRVIDFCHRNAKPHLIFFPYPWALDQSVEFGITEYYMRLVGYGMQVAITPTYLDSHYVQISTFCCTVTCDHNLPTSQTDRRTKKSWRINLGYSAVACRSMRLGCGGWEPEAKGGLVGRAWWVEGFRGEQAHGSGYEWSQGCGWWEVVWCGYCRYDYTT